MQRQRNSWDFECLASPRLKDIDIHQTPREYHAMQIKNLTQGIGMGNEESPISQNLGHFSPYSQLFRQKGPENERINSKEKPQRFRKWPPHKPGEGEEPSIKQEYIDKKIDFNYNDFDYDEVQQLVQDKKQIKEQFISSARQKEQIKRQCVQPSRKSSKKSRPKEKGLRILADHCYSIVKKLETTNYKEVALKLIEELKQEKQISAFQDEKQQLNIKRRVYDALNVLIALGVFSKVGRNVVFNHKWVQNQQHKSQKAAQDFEQLKNKVQKKSIEVKVLKEKFQETYQKAKRFQKLMERNELAESQGKQDQIKIFFPFVGIVFCNLDKQSNKFISPNQFVVKCQGAFDCFGDIDCLEDIVLRKSQKKSASKKQFQSKIRQFTK